MGQRQQTGDKCSIPGCGRQAIVTLQAKPSGHVHNERTEFGFCGSCADEYERMGYEQVDGEGQLRLDG